MKATRIPAVIETVEKVIEPAKIVMELSEDEAVLLGALLGTSNDRLAKVAELNVNTNLLYDRFISLNDERMLKVYNRLHKAGVDLTFPGSVK